MRVLVLLLLLIHLSLLPLAAETYSCRDSQGQLHFADNLQGLPEECLDRAKVIKMEPSGNLQTVPETPVSQRELMQFKQFLREAEQQKKAKQAAVKASQKEATGLLEQYRKLKEEISRARRIWDIRARQQFKKLKQDQKELYAQKLSLLERMKNQRLAEKDIKAVESQLQEITAE